MALPKKFYTLVRRISSTQFQVMVPAGVTDPGLFKTREGAEAWLDANRDQVLAGKQMRSRDCLCCGKRFMSEGNHNRMCGPCRHRGSAEGSPVGYSFGAMTGRRKSA